MSAPELSELELDVIAERIEDLIEKLRRDIAEGGYPPVAILTALSSLVILEVFDCENPGAAFRLFLSDVLQLFGTTLGKSDHDHTRSRRHRRD
jgi:hypothetical protein